MPDVLDLDAGFEAYLRADAALRAAAPGGVWPDQAPQQLDPSTVRVIWRVHAGERRNTHDRQGTETVWYQVVATAEATHRRDVGQAARRLRALLEGARFVAEGWRVIRCEIAPQFGPIVLTEPDGDRRWQTLGRIWEVMATPA